MGGLPEFIEAGRCAGLPAVPGNSGQGEAGNAEGAQGWAHMEAHAEGVAWCGGGGRRTPADRRRTRTDRRARNARGSSSVRQRAGGNRSTRQQQKVRQLMNTMLLAWWRPVNIRIF
ncbi:hypothetical protein GCM10010306_015210 [Streptomyces umbrinus]|nr:hypothetical protein GCM10010306_015210 [Streptomyces umbrinus]